MRPRVKALREFCPTRDTVALTLYFKNQWGEKYRHDVELPISVFGDDSSISEFIEGDGIIEIDTKWEEGRDMMNHVREPLYTVPKPPETAKEYMVDYFRASVHRRFGDQLTDDEVFEIVKDGKEGRWERWQESFESGRAARQEHYEKYLRRKAIDDEGEIDWRTND